jgi:hypothetical protein
MNITTTSLSHLGTVAGIFDELGIAALGQKCRRIYMGNTIILIRNSIQLRSLTATLKIWDGI